MVAVVVMMYPVDILREEELVIFVHMDGTILPPHERVFDGGAVVEFHHGLKHAAVGTQANTNGTFQTILPG